MNHYPHHIGDFNNATRHLTRVERSLYRDLLDLYYDKETPLPLDTDRLARLVLANTQEERAALEVVLQEFFTAHPDGWRNARCDREIAAYRDKIAAASRAGRASAERRQSARNETAEHDGNGGATDVQRTPNERGTNQNQNQNQNQYVSPDGDTGRAPRSVTVTTAQLVSEHQVDEQVANDYLALREAKRAPLTRTALDGLIREFTKAGLTPAEGIRTCTERGWAGFKPEWITNEGRNHGTSNGAGRPRGFEHTDAIGEQWVREHEERERARAGGD